MTKADMKIEMVEVDDPWKDKDISPEVVQTNEKKFLDESHFRKKGEPLQVALNVVVLNLADIDTASQSYNMRLELWVAWPLTEEEVLSYVKNPKEWKPVYHPQPKPWTISIDTFDYMPFMNGTTTQVFLWRGKVVACECVLVTARYLESMELDNFPFDCQHLNFHIGLRCDIDQPMALMPDGRVEVMDLKAIGGYYNFDGRAMAPMSLNPQGCTFNVRNYLLSLQDFQLKGVECEIENKPDDIPFLHCSIRISRYFQSYMYRVFLPMFLILASCTLALRFPPGALADRLSFVGTVLLTIVTFLFIINSLLPQMSYLTVVDKYMNLGFVYVIAIAIICVVLDHSGDEGSDTEVNIMAALFCILGAYHIGMLFTFYLARQKERRKLRMSRKQVDREWEAKMMGTKTGKEDIQEFLVHSDINECDADKIFVGQSRAKVNHGWLFERQAPKARPEEGLVVAPASPSAQPPAQAWAAAAPNKYMAGASPDYTVQLETSLSM